MPVPVPIETCYRSFGRTIRVWRIHRKLTQEELAARVHLTRTSIVNIENGRQRVLLADIERFAKALRIKPLDIARGIWLDTRAKIG